MSKAILLNQALAMQAASGNTSDIDVSNISAIAFDAYCNDKQGTNPTVQYILYRKGADGIYYPIWDSLAISVSGASSGSPVLKSTSIGPGCSYPEELGSTIRLNWVIGGTSSPGAKFSVSIIGE